MKRRLHQCLFVAVVLSLAPGCATMQSRWKEAENQNTNPAYENFLKRYPESELAHEARKRIERLHYEKATQENTIGAYQDFVKRYPHGRFVDEARSKVKTLVTNYIDDIKEIRIEIRSPFKYTESVRYENGKFWAPEISPALKENYKRDLRALVSEILEKFGYEVTNKDFTPILIICYSDREGSGTRKEPDEPVTAFKKYSLHLILTTGQRAQLIKKTYENEVETTSLNTPFSFEKVKQSIDRNLREFFDKVRLMKGK